VNSHSEKSKIKAASNPRLTKQELTGIDVCFPRAQILERSSGRLFQPQLADAGYQGAGGDSEQLGGRCVGLPDSDAETAIESAAQSAYLMSMLSTLKAVVQGDKIHWQEAVDKVLPSDHPVEVLVTILEGGINGLSPEERGRRRVAALERLAELNAFSQVQDPVKWQQESREDRPLPGRDS